jgi:hypothetical protein
MLSRSFILPVLLVAGLVAAGLASSSTGPARRHLALSVSHVYGGGRFGPGTFPNGTLTFAQPRDLSVDAHKVAGVVSGHVYYGRNAGVLLLGVDVKCLVVKGNSAAIGGVVTESGDPEAVGWGFALFLKDNGSPVSQVRDQSSAAFIDPLSASEWPAGFPYVCPSPDGPFNEPGYLDVHSGDVVIRG